MKCITCGKDMNEINVLYRCNEKGIPGIWACLEHRAQNGFIEDGSLDELVETINSETKGMTEESKPEVYVPEVFDPTNPDHIDMIKRVIPDMRLVDRFSNPIHQVFFREGLLAMREFVIDELKQELPIFIKDNALPQIIGNMWPTEWLGPDPGTPRLFDFHELMEAVEWDDDGEEIRWEPIDLSPSIEALPGALGFLQMIGVISNG